MILPPTLPADVIPPLPRYADINMTPHAINITKAVITLRFIEIAFAATPIASRHCRRHTVTIILLRIIAAATLICRLPYHASY